MATRPSIFPEWGTSNSTEAVEIDGVIVSFSSKLEPTDEWKSSGAKYNENTPRQYINYQFDNINQWITHLDGRYAIGDYHLGASADTAGAVSTRLGGTWVSHGTDTVASQTVQLFEKTA